MLRSLPPVPLDCSTGASFRDIPMPLVTSGVEHGNLRELALARMKDLGTECRDVRTREVGIQEIHHKVRPYEVSRTCLIVPLSQQLRLIVLLIRRAGGVGQTRLYG